MPAPVLGGGNATRGCTKPQGVVIAGGGVVNPLHVTTERSLHWIFSILARTQRNTDQAARIRIPETLFYQHGSLRLWYTNDESGEVVRRDKRDCTRDRIMDVVGAAAPFGSLSDGMTTIGAPEAVSRVTNNLGISIAERKRREALVKRRILRTAENGPLPEAPPDLPVAAYLCHVAPDVALLTASGAPSTHAPLSSGHADASGDPLDVLAVEYLDRDGLDAFIANTRAPKHNALLQRFIYGKTPRHASFHVVWSPHQTLVTQRENLHALTDTNASLYDRCNATETAPHLSREMKPTPRIIRVLSDAAAAIVAHVAAVEQRHVVRLIARFAFDEEQRPTLQYCDEVQLSTYPMAANDVRLALAATATRRLLHLAPPTRNGSKVPGATLNDRDGAKVVSQPVSDTQLEASRKSDPFVHYYAAMGGGHASVGKGRPPTRAEIAERDRFESVRRSRLMAPRMLLDFPALRTDGTELDQDYKDTLDAYLSRCSSSAGVSAVVLADAGAPRRVIEAVSPPRAISASLASTSAASRRRHAGSRTGATSSQLAPRHTRPASAASTAASTRHATAHDASSSSVPFVSPIPTRADLKPRYCGGGGGGYFLQRSRTADDEARALAAASRNRSRADDDDPDASSTAAQSDRMRTTTNASATSGAAAVIQHEQQTLPLLPPAVREYLTEALAAFDVAALGLDDALGAVATSIACRDADVTVPLNGDVPAAIAAAGDDAWVPEGASTAVLAALARFVFHQERVPTATEAAALSVALAPQRTGAEAASTVVTVACSAQSPVVVALREQLEAELHAQSAQQRAWDIVLREARTSKAAATTSTTAQQQQDGDDGAKSVSAARQQQQRGPRVAPRPTRGSGGPVLQSMVVAPPAPAPRAHSSDSDAATSSAAASRGATPGGSPAAGELPAPASLGGVDGLSSLARIAVDGGLPALRRKQTALRALDATLRASRLYVILDALATCATAATAAPSPIASPGALSLASTAPSPKGGALSAEASRASVRTAATTTVAAVPPAAAADDPTARALHGYARELVRAAGPVEWPPRLVVVPLPRPLELTPL